MKKTILLVIAAILMIGAPMTAFGLSNYDSGYKHGAADGHLEKAQGSTDLYILQRGQGFSNHTDQFIQGYMDGYCSIKGLGGLDSHDTAFECNTAPTTENNTE